jgi:hypothetical protein
VRLDDVQFRMDQTACGNFHAEVHESQMLFEKGLITTSAVIYYLGIYLGGHLINYLTSDTRNHGHWVIIYLII